LQAQRFTVTDRARCCGGSLSRRFHACICINSALDRYPRAGGVGARLYIYIKIAEIIDDLTCKLNQSINLHVAS
jgi:hypothetical protein